jgi:DNA-binding CsgD family transcriptional regulator/tetratricopeptide (TPR) repeat protein
VLAGIAADGIPAPAEAVVHYERALALWPQVPDPATVAGIAPAELLERAGEATWLGAADAERASALFADALEALDGDDRLKRADLISRQAQCSFEKHVRVGPTLPLHEQALAMLPAEPSLIKARVLARHATAFMFASRFAAGAAQAREAVAVARAAGALVEEADASVTLFVCLACSGDHEEAIGLIDPTRELVEASCHPRPLQRWVVNALYVLQTWSRYDEALEVCEEASGMLQRAGLGRIGQMCTDSAIASVLGVVGRLGEAEALIGHERSVLNAESLPIHFELALIHLMAGELTEAAGDLDALGDPAGIEAAEAIQIYAFRALIALWEGRVGDAAAAIAAAEPRLPAENPYVVAQFLSVAVRVQVEAGSADGADRVLQHCEAILAAGPPCPPAALAGVQLAHAERSRLERRPDPECWRAVAEGWEALGHVYEGIYARWREAQAFAALGGRNHRRIADVVTNALTAAEGAGMQRLAAELRELARRTGVRIGEEDAPQVFRDLTQREREVMGLICAGRTNRQIAEELFITTKTAGTHVSSILLKLGVPSRGAAAAAAHSAGFVTREPTAASVD